MELAGCAAIVTGAGTGVGRATAVELGRRGCSVLVNYSRSKQGAEQTAAEVVALGARAIPHQCDVTDDAACRAMLELAADQFGRLDVLVNNAGTTSFIPHDQLEQVSLDDWYSILGVNLRGPFQCARAARPLLAKQGGEIVNVSSVAGIAGIGSSIPYCASKAALNILTVTLARVMGPQNIRVNAIAPGFIDGEWLRNGLGPAYETIKGAVQGRSPLGRVSTPEDIAAAILAVIEGPDLVTGHVLPVEAGMLIGT